ncbi:MAG: ATP-grasp domain-containing protein [Deltaproteobacteria bacterium]|nr:ATP-grasp domain-containing protein [Deltaproteobacteria bacterium]
MSVETPVKTILCVSSFYKGARFIEQAKKLGCRTILLTVENILKEAWPRHALDEVFAMPNFKDRRAVINAVSYLARTRKFDRIAPLDDFDVELVAHLREHLRIPGMGDTTARYFRDKLAMRSRAKDRGILVPDFVATINHDDIRHYLANVQGPWVLKPRSEASSVGIKKIKSAEELWPILESLGDQQSYYLLEKMIAGDCYHVDSITWDRKVVFAEANKYRRPMLEVSHEGGIFASRTLPRDGDEAVGLRAMNEDVIREFGHVRGVSHTEFIRGAQDGKFYFLETAARVGGAGISDLVEAATGVNLWEEWAKIEVSQGETPYTPPVSRGDYAGIVVSLTRYEQPDNSGFNDPEIVYRMDDKPWHLGLVVRSKDPSRVEQLIESYVLRIQRDFHASAPVLTIATA